jgi:hypothetical protein
LWIAQSIAEFKGVGKILFNSRSAYA